MWDRLLRPTLFGEYLRQGLDHAGMPKIRRKYLLQNVLIMRSDHIPENGLFMTRSIKVWSQMQHTEDRRSSLPRLQDLYVSLKKEYDRQCMRHLMQQAVSANLQEPRRYNNNVRRNCEKVERIDTSNGLQQQQTLMYSNLAYQQSMPVVQPHTVAHSNSRPLSQALPAAQVHEGQAHYCDRCSKILLLCSACKAEMQRLPQPTSQQTRQSAELIAQTAPLHLETSTSRPAWTQQDKGTAMHPSGAAAPTTDMAKADRLNRSSPSQHQLAAKITEEAREAQDAGINQLALRAVLQEVSDVLVQMTTLKAAILSQPQQPVQPQSKLQPSAASAPWNTGRPPSEQEAAALHVATASARSGSKTAQVSATITEATRTSVAQALQQSRTRPATVQSQPLGGYKMQWRASLGSNSRPVVKATKQPTNHMVQPRANMRKEISSIDRVLQQQPPLQQLIGGSQQEKHVLAGSAKHFNSEARSAQRKIAAPSAAAAAAAADSRAKESPWKTYLPPYSSMAKSPSRSDGKQKQKCASMVAHNCQPNASNIVMQEPADQGQRPFHSVHTRKQMYTKLPAAVEAGQITVQHQLPGKCHKAFEAHSKAESLTCGGIVEQSEAQVTKRKFDDQAKRDVLITEGSACSSGVPEEHCSTASERQGLASGQMDMKQATIAAKEKEMHAERVQAAARDVVLDSNEREGPSSIDMSTSREAQRSLERAHDGESDEPYPSESPKGHGSSGALQEEQVHQRSEMIEPEDGSEATQGVESHNATGKSMLQERVHEPVMDASTVVPQQDTEQGTSAVDAAVKESDATDRKGEDKADDSTSVVSSIPEEIYTESDFGCCDDEA